MKPIIPAISLSLILGALAGWLARGEKSPPADPGTENTAAARPSKSSERPQPSSPPREERLPGKARIRTESASSPVQPLDADEFAKKWADSFAEQNDKRAEKRAAELAAKLGLSAGQTEKLKDFLKRQTPMPMITLGGDGKKTKVAEFKTQLDGSGKDLETFMKELLTAEQSDAYEELKTTERNQRIEAHTLREMASVTQAIQIRDDQRDAVYSALQQEARETVGNGSLRGMPEPFAGSIVGLSDIADNAGAVSIRISGDGASGGDGELMDQIKEQERTRIDNKVNRLDGILDPDQLAGYRSYLEERSPLLAH